MNIYQYIAHNSPNECYQICKSYGYYDIEDINELSETIAKIVSQNGEKSFVEFLELHPDKEVILEVYKPTTPKPLQNFSGSTQEPQPVILEQNPLAQKYFNAEGNKLTNQTNLYILVGAIVVSLAIISIRK
jgi:hypothetical protein